MAFLPRYSLAQTIAQDNAYYAILTAKLDKLFNRSGARDDEREAFLSGLNAAIADLTRAQDEADEWSGEPTDSDTARSIFRGTRGCEMVAPQVSA